MLAQSTNCRSKGWKRWLTKGLECWSMKLAWDACKLALSGDLRFSKALRERTSKSFLVNSRLQLCLTNTAETKTRLTCSICLLIATCSSQGQKRSSIYTQLQTCQTWLIEINLSAKWWLFQSKTWPKCKTQQLQIFSSSKSSSKTLSLWPLTSKPCASKSTLPSQAMSTCLT